MTQELIAFNSFFLKYQKRLIFFAQSFVHDEMVAEDCVIDAITYYWQHREGLTTDVEALNYVLTVLKHKCIDYLRRQERTVLVSDEVESWDLMTRIAGLQEFDPKEIFTKEVVDIVERTLNDMPAKMRTVFIMSRYENKSQNEIAEATGLSVRGVEYNLYKALGLLRHALRDYVPLYVLWLYFS